MLEQLAEDRRRIEIAELLELAEVQALPAPCRATVHGRTARHRSVQPGEHALEESLTGSWGRHSGIVGGEGAGGKSKGMEDATNERDEAVDTLLASLPVGTQNRGGLAEHAIGGRPAREVVEEVVLAAESTTGLRRRALRALHRLDDPRSERVYVTLLASSAGELVEATLHDLVHDRPGVRWIGPLRDALRARAPHRGRIALALAALGAVEALADLEELGRAEPSLTDTARTAMARIVRRPLADLSEWRAHVPEPLEPGWSERLRADLEHAEERVRDAALEDLALRGDPAARAPLLALAAEGKTRRHRAASLALRLAFTDPTLRADARCLRYGKPHPAAALELLRALAT